MVGNKITKPTYNLDNLFFDMLSVGIICTFVMSHPFARRELEKSSVNIHRFLAGYSFQKSLSCAHVQYISKYLTFLGSIF
jgi:hypothetical protein